jgi:hypothetical protein
LDPVQVLPAHGPVIDQPIALIDRYTAHRHAREAEILAAIERGAETIDAIVAAVYPQLEDPLRKVAVETVHAHVRKLVDEGRIDEAFGGAALP